VTSSGTGAEQPTRCPVHNGVSQSPRQSRPARAHDPSANPLAPRFFRSRRPGGRAPSRAPRVMPCHRARRASKQTGGITTSALVAGAPARWIRNATTYFAIRSPRCRWLVGATRPSGPRMHARRVPDHVYGGALPPVRYENLAAATWSSLLLSFPEHLAARDRVWFQTRSCIRTSNPSFPSSPAHQSVN
jgi:hypothetical protein